MTSKIPPNKPYSPQDHPTFNKVENKGWLGKRTVIQVSDKHKFNLTITEKKNSKGILGKIRSLKFIEVPLTINGKKEDVMINIGSLARHLGITRSEVRKLHKEKKLASVLEKIHQISELDNKDLKKLFGTKKGDTVDLATAAFCIAMSQLGYERVRYYKPHKSRYYTITPGRIEKDKEYTRRGNGKYIHETRSLNVSDLSVGIETNEDEES